jgi:hypothetical protein
MRLARWHSRQWSFLHFYGRTIAIINDVDLVGNDQEPVAPVTDRAWEEGKRV